MPRNVWFPYRASSAAATAPLEYSSSGDEIEIVCFPHAGAGASTYRGWAATVPAGLSVRPVQPPGRENRVREPAYCDVHALIRDLLPAFVGHVAPPFALYGHSTGAIIAFELSRALRREGAAMPLRLFVSGRRAPQLTMPITPVGSSDLAGLRAILRRLGGTPEEILNDEEMLARLQPLLAGDFQLNETYAYYDDLPLPIPITAFSADEDAGAGPAEMRPWAKHTAVGFDHVVLRGGHFAVFDQSARVQDHMLKRMTADQPGAGPASRVESGVN